MPFADINGQRICFEDSGGTGCHREASSRCAPPCWRRARPRAGPDRHPAGTETSAPAAYRQMQETWLEHGPIDQVTEAIAQLIISSRRQQVVVVLVVVVDAGRIRDRMVQPVD